MSVITAMGKFTNVQTEYAIKDNLPRDATNVTAQIIVGTPGTMTDLIRRKVSRLTKSCFSDFFFPIV
jgi:ATP-dependent RNA helicase DDX19/DBP5